jgi:hypothetical protein
MKYSFDETEIKKIREKVSLLNSKIEKAVLAQKYNTAFELKKKEKELEKEISEIKNKFSIPKNERLNV